jgi:hypothetical protein
MAWHSQHDLAAWVIGNAFVEGNTIQGCMVEVDELICVAAFIQTVCFHHWWDGWSVTTGVIVSNF